MKEQVTTIQITNRSSSIDLRIINIFLLRLVRFVCKAQMVVYTFSNTTYKYKVKRYSHGFRSAFNSVCHLYVFLFPFFYLCCNIIIVLFVIILYSAQLQMKRVWFSRRQIHSSYVQPINPIEFCFTAGKLKQ